MFMRVILILNPASGVSPMASHAYTAEETAQLIVSAFQAAAIEPEIWYTTLEDAGQGLAQRAASEGADVVVVAGGDGTLHAVASGLIGSQTKLGIIPMGTMNNIAHSLDIPTDIEHACEVIIQGAVCQLDVGKINDQIFLEVAGIGIEAALFPAAEEFKSPGLFSGLNGAYRGLITLCKFRPTRFWASFDGKRSRPFDAIQISICNTPYYGAHLQFAPDAAMDDGLLDVLIYRNFSKIAYLRHAIAISQGRRVFEPKLRQRKVGSLSIFADPPVEIHADGNPLGYTPATITIIPAALCVCVPLHVATGPNVTPAAIERTKYYRKVHTNTLLEDRNRSCEETLINQ
jgi:diacylglycerol kinase (ATP)